MSEVYSRIIMAYVQPREGCPRLCSRSMQQMAILVKARDYSHIEREVRLEKVVRAGISTLRQELERELNQHLPLGYDDYVLNDGSCEALNVQLSDDERKRKFINVMLEVMEAMHDAWVRRESEDFCRNATEMRWMNDQFKRLFVPFLLLGWKIVRRYYDMALALVMGCEPLPAEILVRKFYEERSRDFCKSHGIHDVQSLQNRLKEGAKFYPALNGRAEEVLARTQNSSRIATVIVESGALLN